jgi:biopolymer transport protein ExbD
MADVSASQSRGKQKHSGKKKKKRIAVRLDMTPMVDVAFLLLTFFILTTTMSKPETMEINLPPDSKINVEVPASNLLTLRVTQEFNLYWCIGTDKPEKIDGTDKKSRLVNLGKTLKEKNKANSKLITLIQVDGKAKYIDMVDVMDELNINDINRFSLTPMTDRDKQIIEKL